MERIAHPWQGGRTLSRAGIAAATLGLAGWGTAVALDPRRALFSYLTAYVYVLTIVVGALIFLMTVHAARAEWPASFRVLVERLVALLPWLTVLFVPVALGVHRVYVWAGAEPADAHLSEVMLHQAPYLNVPFALVRGFLFLLFWSGIGLSLIHFSHRLDETGDPRWKERQWRLSGGGLVLTALTLTFFSIDWLMSLTPSWFSTIFGFYVFAGGFLSAFALTVVLMVAAERTGPLAGLLQAGHYLSMGKLMLAFTIFWAYMAFSQYLIIWIGDIPAEASWYIVRSTGWAGISILLAFVHFVVPFAALLSRDLKKQRGRLMLVACWILVAHYIDVYWLVMPALHIGGPQPHWMDLAALLLVGGSCLAVGTATTRGKSLVPLRDPDLAVAVRYEGA